MLLPVIEAAEKRGLFLPDDGRAYEKKMKRLEAEQIELQKIGCYIQLLFLSLHGQKRLEPETDSRSALIFRDAVSYMTEKSGEMPGIEEIARAWDSRSALIFRDAVSYMTEKSGEMPGIEEIARACHTSCTGLQNVFFGMR